MPPLTPLMVFRVFDQTFGDYKYRFKRDYVSLEEISPNLQKAVIASEDQKFTEHHGFDFGAMEKAFKNNLKNKRIKGGSTISQQVAKNVFLWQGRSYLRKGLEAYFTLLIEVFWSKERILEMYLNVIEMGNGIYGAEAASQYYFETPAKSLSKKDAALIAAILPNPRKWNPTKPSSYLKKRQCWIVKNIPAVKLASATSENNK